jgi:hypothetical protein
MRFPAAWNPIDASPKTCVGFRTKEYLTFAEELGNIAARRKRAVIEGGQQETKDGSRL